MALMSHFVPTVPTGAIYERDRGIEPYHIHCPRLGSHGSPTDHALGCAQGLRQWITHFLAIEGTVLLGGKALDRHNGGRSVALPYLQSHRVQDQRCGLR